MENTREVDYEKLTGKAYKLGRLIHAEMEKPDPMTDPRWAELHDVSKAVSAVFCTLARYRDRQAAENAPQACIAGLRDLDAAVRAANPGHAVFTEPAPPALASCGHPADEDGEHDCSWWPERAPAESLGLYQPRNEISDRFSPR